MSWTNQIDKVTSKAHNTLNFLRRNMYACPPETKELAFKTLVRPILEYGASCWDPHLTGRIGQIEKVQRKAARFVTGNWRYTSSVSEMLKELQWQSLQERRLVRRLTLLYQAHHHLFAIDIPSYVTLSTRPSPRRHPIQYITIPAKTSVYGYSYWPRTIQSWNVIPSDIIQKPSAASFKEALTQSLSTGVLRVVNDRAITSRILSPAARRETPGCSTVLLF